MRLRTTTIAALALIGFTLTAQAQEMTEGEARRALAESTGLAYVHRNHFFKVDPGSVRITATGIAFDTEYSGHYSVAFADLDGLKLLCNKRECKLTISGNEKLPPSVPPLMWNDKKTKWGCASACQQQAAEFVAALNKLVSMAANKADPVNAFPAQAAAWHALATKPPLPDAVRVRSLLAEDSVREKNPREALKYYRQGLDLYPLWPQGWFNAAVICGELRDYNNAAEFMQNYLLLVPDAPDAPQARDQIEMWKIKAKERN
jgi:hypothetical protein